MAVYLQLHGVMAEVREFDSVWFCVETWHHFNTA